MKKNFLLLTISILISFSFFYLIFFTYNYFKKYENNPYLFKSIEDVKFNKYYSKKLHHLRGHNQIKNKKNTSDYIFTTINNFKNKDIKILMQGDSYIEQLVEVNNDLSYAKLYNFVYKNYIGLINSGTTSYSPSLMQIQFGILEKDFDIKPNIIIAYIDQTDLGDELCRYKNNKNYDENGELISIKNTNYSRAVFEYTRINNISEILLSNKTNISKTFKLTNFLIKYSYKRLEKKFYNIYKYGWKNKDVNKCHFSEITKYLKNIDSNDLKYFENRVDNYIKFLLKKKYIEQIFIVTFPHYNHLYEKDFKKKYNVNVSNVIDNLIKKYSTIPAS